MKLKEAKEILKENGYRLSEARRSTVDNFLNGLSKFDATASHNFWLKFNKALEELGYNNRECDSITHNFWVEIRKLRDEGVAPEEIAGTVSNYYEEIMSEDNKSLDEALEGPATSKQLWTLFKLTKQDYRNKNLSKEDAFKMIGELLDKKKNGETTTKPTNVNKATPKAPDADSPVKIGEIYHRMWGYSMCINDYYKVIDVKGNKALVVELPKKAISGDLTQGKVVPIDVENPSRNEAVLALIKPDGTLRIKNSIHKYETFHQWDGEPDWEDHWD